MTSYNNQTFEGERALFEGQDLDIRECVFQNGESPLKHADNVTLTGSTFAWKYPLWYAKNIKVNDGIWKEMGRAGVWYSNNVTVDKAYIEAPKNFRRCDKLILSDVQLPNAQETLWSCSNVELKNVSAKGDYFAMNCCDIKVGNLNLDGNYSFDGCKNVEVRDSRLMSKDAFWNCENVTVYNSYICGEYLGWNSKNVTLIDCTISSLQGMCYIDNLVMKNCKLEDTTLAFEYSNVDAEVTGNIVSVLNPSSGTIKADSIDMLILEKDKSDFANLKIVCDDVKQNIDKDAVKYF